MAKEKERYIALSTTDEPTKEERYLKFTAATRLKKPQSEFSRAKCSPSTLSIPSDDKSKVVVIREKRPQILAPKKRRSNMPAPNTGTDVPTYIAYKTKSPTATARPAYYGYQGALGSNLLTRQIDRVRLEHERVMKEERGQNCCLCGLLALSIFVAAALLAVGFYDRTMPRGSTNLTKSEEIDSPIYFAEVEINQDAQTPSFNTSRNINKENYTKAPSYRREFKNLTELCSAKIEPHGCFYHKNVYPDDCFRTSVNRFDWYYTQERAIMDVQDGTPCMPGKLCIGGECIEHPDASHYIAPESHPGGVRVMCNSSRTCVRIDGTLIEGELAQHYMSCEKRSCESHTFPSKLILNEIAVRFLSCSNPYPVNMDPGCFPRLRSQESEYAPFLIYDFCLKCVSDYSNDSCSTFIDVFAPLFGIPCYSGSPKNINTFCAGFKSCVPLYKEYPETYSIRPIQKC